MANPELLPSAAPTDWGPPELRLTHERGPMTRQVREAALREGGDAGWDQVLGLLSPPCRARFSQPIGYFEWVESELALELHGAWRSLRGQEIMAQRGMDAAREIFGGAHRWLLGLATPGLLVQTLPRLFAFYYRGGRVVVDRLEEGEADLSLWAWGYPSSWYAEGLSACIQVALELTRGSGVGVAYDPPGPDDCRHRYRMRWEA